MLDISNLQCNCEHLPPPLSLSPYLSVCLSVCLSIYLSIYLFYFRDYPDDCCLLAKICAWLYTYLINKRFVLTEYVCYTSGCILDTTGMKRPKTD